MDSNRLEARENKLAVFENVVPKEKTYTTRTFFGKTYLEDSLSSSESDLIIDERAPAAKRKEKTQVLKLNEEPLNICCKWAKCKLKFSEYPKLIFHLRDHVTQRYKLTKKKFTCLWKKCKFIATSSLYLIQHVVYHGYHTRLMNVGENIAERQKLPNCTQEYQFEIPFHEKGFDCMWEDCGTNFVTFYDFVEHMVIHVKNNPAYCKNDEVIECLWKDCPGKFKSQYILRNHVRTHTTEKLVACNKCGKTFATRTKFSDHRKRQLPIDMQGYQCSQCSKLFASERLLRDHIRSHINHYKCSMCDMTCTKPSLLALHIRHRHLDDRPFKCNLCKHACVTKQNLEYHLITHCAEKLLECDKCDYKCRSMPGLDRHYQKVHSQWEQYYECHCCKKLFAKGGHLTKHLMRVHDFHWPSGHSRFRYKEDPDHIFRLQTVRYESLEVTEQILKNKSTPKQAPKPSVFKYSLKKRQKTRHQRGPDYVVAISEHVETPASNEANNPDDPSPSDARSGEILITIEDVDADGNVLRSEVVHANAVVCDDSQPIEGTVLKFEEGETCLHKEGSSKQESEVKVDLKIESVDTS